MKNIKELLLKPNWNYQDICDYFDCKKSKAYEIMRIVKTKFNGTVRFNSSVVLRDSCLAYAGTSIEREIYIKNQLEKGGIYAEKTIQKREIRQSFGLVEK